MKEKSLRSLRRDLAAARRSRTEWIELFGDKPTRGLGLLTQRVERLSVRVCFRESRATVWAAFG